MKDKFIRVVSPISAIIIFIFDIAAAVLGYFSLKALRSGADFYTVSFIVIEIVVIIASVLSTVQMLKNGILFTEKEIEFTGLDDNNKFEFSQIVSIETHKDTSVSFKKSMTERFSSIILYLDDNSIASIELGITTKKKLKVIEEEIKKRI